MGLVYARPRIGPKAFCTHVDSRAVSWPVHNVLAASITVTAIMDGHDRARPSNGGCFSIWW